MLLEYVRICKGNARRVLCFVFLLDVLTASPVVLELPLSPPPCHPLEVLLMLFCHTRHLLEPAKPHAVLRAQRYGRLYPASHHQTR